MKWIKYQYVCNILNEGTEDEEVILLDKKIGYSEANLVVAQKEAYNGQYEIVEDGETVKSNPLPIELGGTGATTKAGARQKLGIVDVFPEGFGIDGMIVLDEDFGEGFYIDSNMSYVVKCGNQVNAFLYVTPVSDSVKAISEAGTKNDLRKISVPYINIVDENIMPFMKIGIIQAVAYCKDIDSKGSSIFSNHCLVMHMSEREESYTIAPDIDYINSKTATALDHIEISCSWIVKQ